MRSGEPAKLTLSPRATSASATASDGRTWPAVPPAAIRHLSALCSGMSRDVKEDAYRGERHNEARPAVGHERKRDSGQRSEPENRRQIDERLPADECRQPGCEALPERIAAAQSHPQTGVREGAIRRDH